MVIMVFYFRWATSLLGWNGFSRFWVGLRCNIVPGLPQPIVSISRAVSWNNQSKIWNENSVSTHNVKESWVKYKPWLSWSSFLDGLRAFLGEVVSSVTFKLDFSAPLSLDSLSPLAALAGWFPRIIKAKQWISTDPSFFCLIDITKFLLLIIGTAE